MKRLVAAIAALLTLAAADAPPLPRVALTTAEGVVVIELERDRAPVTASNFLRYVDQKRLDGAVFYRAMKLTPDGSYGLIQGGLRGDPKKKLPPIAHEPTTKTGLSHVDGAVSMARLAPGTAGSEFFISIGALTSLDAQPAGTGDIAGFAVFGRVVEGMDAVKRILAAPASPTQGEGVMRGQMIAAPVKILSARRMAAPPPINPPTD